MTKVNSLLILFKFYRRRRLGEKEKGGGGKEKTGAIGEIGEIQKHGEK